MKLWQWALCVVGVVAVLALGIGVGVYFGGGGGGDVVGPPPTADEVNRALNVQHTGAQSGMTIEQANDVLARAQHYASQQQVAPGGQGVGITGGGAPMGNAPMGGALTAQGAVPQPFVNDLVTVKQGGDANLDAAMTDMVAATEKMRAAQAANAVFNEGLPHFLERAQLGDQVMRMAQGQQANAPAQAAVHNRIRAFLTANNITPTPMTTLPPATTTPPPATTTPPPATTTPPPATTTPPPATTTPPPATTTPPPTT